MNRQPNAPGNRCRVALLDAGGQYVDLVKRAIERQGYVVDVLPLATHASKLRANYGAVVISGSPANSSENGEVQVPDKTLWEDDSYPILGICFGMQAMAVANGGLVKKGLRREDGLVKTKVDTNHVLFNSVKADLTALFTHGDFVIKLPTGFRVIGHHKTGKEKVISAIAKGKIVGVQFHPEVFDDTPEGYQIFSNFLGAIAGLKPDREYSDKLVKALANKLTSDLTRRAKDKHVIAFVSGGVDSAVATLLASCAVDKSKLHAFYIDNGFMRIEDEQVIDMLHRAGLVVEKIKAEKYFAEAKLSGGGEPLVDATDPEIKRKIIGKAFVDIQNKLLKKLKLKEALLLQGTNAADRIESGHSKAGGNTATIKTHHNTVSEIQDLKQRGLLLEPLDELFKDEVRHLGRKLGLPSEVTNRHPFPGPGLAIRVICHGGQRAASPHPQPEARVLQDSVKSYGLKARILPIRSVGVGGDERSHLSPVVLGGTANWQVLNKLAHELPARFRSDINRVTFALGQAGIERISLTRTNLSKACLNQLRQADYIVFEELRRAKLMSQIAQCPVVLLPISFGQKGKRSIVIRPVKTLTFMTVQAMLPGRDLPEIFIKQTAARILNEVPGVSQVLLDLTNKPPATTEWE